MKETVTIKLTINFYIFVEFEISLDELLVSHKYIIFMSSAKKNRIRSQTKNYVFRTN